jgi:hypothetical protein
MNPYASDLDKIFPHDRYHNEPFYSRYLPKPDDFELDPNHINSTSTELLEYWVSVLDLCTAFDWIYGSDGGGRDLV